MTEVKRRIDAMSEEGMREVFRLTVSLARLLFPEEFKLGFGQHPEMLQMVTENRSA